MPRDERCGFHRAAGKLIGTDLHRPYLDGVTAHIDRGVNGRALSHSSRFGRRHGQRSSSTYRSACGPADATPITCDSAAEAQTHADEHPEHAGER